MIDLALIKKYNVQGPRYTSYPTAAQFHEVDKPQSSTLLDDLRERNRAPRPISLYFHIPFCFSLCWYCGCTKIITKNNDRGDGYLDYLEKELTLMVQIIHPQSEVVQIHFGGGTPTFLSPRQLKRLGEIIAKHFQFTQKTEFSVEIDPRECSEEQIEVLAEIGCNRASLGVQDTNEAVQKAINRIQPFSQTKQVTDWLRKHGICAINYDLIYGLPKQNLATFQQTMNDVLSMQPDRLAVYSYAHIPALMPSQKLLDTKDFPSTDEKLKMLQASISYLTSKDYRFIGMDHFSKENEELSKAMDANTLQRNFQGYSTKAKTDLYAFGMSGISMVGNWYWQNTKDLAQYYKEIDQGDFPISKALKLHTDDLIRQEVIMDIMCKTNVDYQRISDKWNIDFKTYFSKELSALKSLQADHLVHISKNGLSIPTKGRLFLRNIAMYFDAYLNQALTKHHFSKTV